MANKKIKASSGVTLLRIEGAGAIPAPAPPFHGVYQGMNNSSLGRLELLRILIKLALESRRLNRLFQAAKQVGNQ